MRKLIAAAVVTLAALAFTKPAGAWSTKEHVQLTRIAAMQLIASPETPADMKAWLTAAVPGITDMAGERDHFINKRMGMYPHGVDGIPFWAVIPDMNALTDKYNKKLEPLKVPEGPMHYFELEFYGPNPPKPDTKPRAAGKELLGDAAAPPSAAPPQSEASRPAQKPDLKTKPTLDKIPRDTSNAKRLNDGGALPWRAQECYEKLVAQIKAGRLDDKAGQYPRDEHAAYFAGFVAHYLQDATQPQHTTWDYRSRAFFPPGTKSPNAHEVVEYRMADDDVADNMELRDAYWPLFVAALNDTTDPAKDGKDTWEQSVQTVSYAYDALPLIGEASVAAWDKTAKTDDAKVEGAIDIVKFYNHRGLVRDKEMSVLELKAHMQGIAVRRTMATWLAAWKEAKRQ